MPRTYTAATTPHNSALLKYHKYNAYNAPPALSGAASSNSRLDRNTQNWTQKQTKENQNSCKAATEAE